MKSSSTFLVTSLIVSSPQTRKHLPCPRSLRPRLRSGPLRRHWPSDARRAFRCGWPGWPRHLWPRHPAVGQIVGVEENVSSELVEYPFTGARMCCTKKTRSSVAGRSPIRRGLPRPGGQPQQQSSPHWHLRSSHGVPTLDISAARAPATRLPLRPAGRVAA
jgi:hypothetical protein